MTGTVNKDIAPEEIVRAGKGMKKRQREAFLEDLLAATSPEYLASILDARADYQARRAKSHEELFPTAPRIILHPQPIVKTLRKMVRTDRTRR